MGILYALVAAGRAYALRRPAKPGRKGFALPLLAELESTNFLVDDKRRMGKKTSQPERREKEKGRGGGERWAGEKWMSGRRAGDPIPRRTRRSPPRSSLSPVVQNRNRMGWEPARQIDRQMHTAGSQDQQAINSAGQGRGGGFIGA